MKSVINAAVQILPLKGVKDGYSIVDKAIEVIQESGLRYVVCPFETVIEGEYLEVMAVIEKMQDVCHQNGVTNLLCNIKLHSHSNKAASIDDKMKKYS